MLTICDELFKRTQFPVIVCGYSDNYPLVYANPAARFQFNPLLTVEQLKDDSVSVSLSDLLRYENEGYLTHMETSLTTLGEFDLPSVRIITAAGNAVNARVFANLADHGGEKYLIFYFFSHDEEGSSADRYNYMSLVFRAAYNEMNADAALGNVLAIAGEAVHVSRAYIFEPAGLGFCKNTYEWCAPGVVPVIDSLQNLRNEDYNYDVIVQGGMYITDDIRDLPEEDFKILDAQGIKSLAIIPLVRSGVPIGYMGFDDCENYRVWTSAETQLLSNITNVVISLIERRNTAITAALSYEILQTISDNSGNVIYVTNIDTHEVIFVNKSLAQSMGKNVADFIGKPCWQVLQRDKNGPCDFCPLKKMIDPNGNVLNDTYTWEFQNTVTGNWYIAKDSIVQWIDGSLVHMESATDISSKKEQEEQLRYYASVDAMTGTYNREWGYQTMSDLFTELRSDTTGKKLSLCFLDIDGLKKTNDTYGHQAGDDLIISTVDAIRSCIRKTDLICRWGGDEFVVLLQCEKSIAVKLVLRAQNKLSELNEAGSRPYKLAFSYGIMEISSDCEMDLDSVILSLDKLMYEDKMRK